ncbi:MAG: YhcH/YjgK/YiaL family protein [Clostridia bacterium]|nr:YhcH/YjgK/YiaL family protein [Clostridia bacterium]
MLTTSLKLADKYNYLEDKFQRAFEFLRTADLKSLPLGRTDIDGDNIFASVQEYKTMSPKDCKFEAHDKYFDIQYVVKGREQFGYVKRDGLEVDEPYDEVNDLVFYKEPENSGSILLNEGDLAIAPPEYAHKPRCIEKETCNVRKIVVKVKL